jgi:hypothetical protein
MRGPSMATGVVIVFNSKAAYWLALMGFFFVPLKATSCV